MLRMLEGRRTSVTPVWTTRPRTQDELRGVVEHRFVSEEEFDKLAASGTFLEVFTTDDLPYRYGLPPLQEPRRPHLVPVVAMRAVSMDVVDRQCPDRIIYQIEPEEEKAHHRLRVASADADELSRRLQSYEAERLAGREVADRVFPRHVSPDYFLREVSAALDEDYPLEGTPPP